jgi:hypothetical protein
VGGATHALHEDLGAEEGAEVGRERNGMSMGPTGGWKKKKKYGT